MMRHHDGWMLVCDVEPVPAVISTPDGAEIHGIALRIRGHECAADEACPEDAHTWIYLAMPPNVASRMANGLAMLPLMEGQEWANFSGMPYGMGGN